MATDPLDFSDRYNTQLSPQQEAQFQAWAQKLGPRASSYDYDMRGAFAAGAGQAANGHFPDTYKKPNHPTFSDQSIYSGQDGFRGGQWAKQADGSWSFTPSASSLKLHDPQELQSYFSRVEPGNKLNLPMQAPADLTTVYAALQKADAAGDTAGAKQLADFIRSQSGPSVRSYDLVNGQPVPTGSAVAKEAESPIARPDPNSSSPVGSEISAMLQNAASGAGKAFVDLGRGAGQYLGLVSRQDVQDSRLRDAPLMATGAGRVGNIVGNIAATTPALAIPGANTVAGAGLIGAATGALQPSTSTGETLRNTALGGALGAGGQATANFIAKRAGQAIAERAQTAADLTSANSERDAVLQAGRKEGYVIPPTEVNPSATATALESVSGKAATKQAAQAQNQVVTNRLVAQDLKLPANAPITPQALAGVRQQAGQVYSQVKQAGQITADSAYQADLAAITNASKNVQSGFPGAVTPAGDKVEALVQSLDQPNFSAAQALEYTKRLRQQASSNFTVAARSGDPEARALASAQIKGADALEEMIGRHLQANGQPQLLQEFQDARTLIAKSYQAQAALRGGNVSATRLAQQKGKPMSDGFGLVARFADHFGDATKLPKGGVGVSKLAAALGGSGVVTGLATGNIPLAAAAAAGTVAPWTVRQGLLSGIGQRALATPDYTPSLLGTLSLRALQASPTAVLPGTAATLPLIQAGQ
jgi:hypothetical protein